MCLREKNQVANLVCFYLLLILIYFMSVKRVHLKLVTFGRKYSGKTCLIKRYCEKYFENEYHPTVIIDYG